MLVTYIKETMDLLTCGVCLDPASSPKLCPKCTKYFCNECINQVYQSRNDAGCPLCRAVVALGDYLNVPWLDELKQKIHEMQHQLEAYIKPTTSMCGFHESKRLSMYCEVCSTSLCYQCWKSHSFHSPIIPIEVAQENASEKVKQYLLSVKKSLVKYEKFQSTQNDRIITHNENKTVTSDLIKKVCDEMMKSAIDDLNELCLKFDNAQAGLASPHEDLTKYAKEIENLEKNHLLDNFLDKANTLVEPSKIISAMENSVRHASKTEPVDPTEFITCLVPPTDINAEVILTKSDFESLSQQNVIVCFSKKKLREAEWSAYLSGVRDGTAPAIKIDICLKGASLIDNYDLEIESNFLELDSFRQSMHTVMPNQFQSDFLRIDMPKCDTLFRENGSPELYIGIQPRSYRHKCLDLEMAYKHLRHVHSETEDDSISTSSDTNIVTQNDAVHNSEGSESATVDASLTIAVMTAPPTAAASTSASVMACTAPPATSESAEDVQGPQPKRARQTQN